MICDLCGHNNATGLHGYLDCVENLRVDIKIKTTVLLQQAEEVRLQQDYLQELRNELEAERGRCWEGWEYSVAAEEDFKECFNDLMQIKTALYNLLIHHDALMGHNGLSCTDCKQARALVKPPVIEVKPGN